MKKYFGVLSAGHLFLFSAALLVVDIAFRAAARLGEIPTFKSLDEISCYFFLNKGLCLGAVFNPRLSTLWGLSAQLANIPWLGILSIVILSVFLCSIVFFYDRYSEKTRILLRKLLPGIALMLPAALLNVGECLLLGSVSDYVVLFSKAGSGGSGSVINLADAMLFVGHLIWCAVLLGELFLWLKGTALKVARLASKLASTLTPR